jgi:hypothetical protein
MNQILAFVTLFSYTSWIYTRFLTPHSWDRSAMFYGLIITRVRLNPLCIKNAFIWLLIILHVFHWNPTQVVKATRISSKGLRFFSSSPVRWLERLVIFSLTALLYLKYRLWIRKHKYIGYDKYFRINLHFNVRMIKLHLMVSVIKKLKLSLQKDVKVKAHSFRVVRCRGSPIIQTVGP